MEKLNHDHAYPNCPACEQVGQWKAEAKLVQQKAKLEAAEEMAKTLENTRLSLSICLMPRLDLNVAGNESIIEITIAGLSAALLLWEKAGKGDDEAQNKTL